MIYFFFTYIYTFLYPMPVTNLYMGLNRIYTLLLRKKNDGYLIY
jgi:hypothetical protein